MIAWYIITHSEGHDFNQICLHLKRLRLVFWWRGVLLADTHTDTVRMNCKLLSHALHQSRPRRVRSHARPHARVDLDVLATMPPKQGPPETGVATPPKNKAKTKPSDKTPTAFASVFSTANACGPSIC